MSQANLLDSRVLLETFYQLAWFESHEPVMIKGDSKKTGGMAKMINTSGMLPWPDMPSPNIEKLVNLTGTSAATSANFETLYDKCLEKDFLLLDPGHFLLRNSSCSDQFSIGQTYFKCLTWRIANGLTDKPLIIMQKDFAAPCHMDGLINLGQCTKLGIEIVTITKYDAQQHYPMPEGMNPDGKIKLTYEPLESDNGWMKLPNNTRYDDALTSLEESVGKEYKLIMDLLNKEVEAGSLPPEVSEWTMGKDIELLTELMKNQLLIQPTLNILARKNSLRGLSLAKLGKVEDHATIERLVDLFNAYYGHRRYMIRFAKENRTVMYSLDGTGQCVSKKDSERGSEPNYGDSGWPIHGWGSRKEAVAEAQTMLTHFVVVERYSDAAYICRAAWKKLLQGRTLFAGINQKVEAGIASEVPENKQDFEKTLSKLSDLFKKLSKEPRGIVALVRNTTDWDDRRDILDDNIERLIDKANGLGGNSKVLSKNVNNNWRAFKEIMVA
ncbi:hypothetical protein J8M20_01180 [Pseudoalteromonas luteoviolacea]|uniref:hypothetical protein n=1 Tax=Pseudoalteromonas luteoviolacea TaxID=43657 RepID=UPI001B35D78E|nr:hypothetical protein [Pseudoalteromonas luteoviolacea]MBQ4809920.1 hypothetical protein [Pseudoalteromonas luteoviolacea]